jgi:hypothetical protein
MSDITIGPLRLDPATARPISAANLPMIKLDERTTEALKRFKDSLDDPAARPSPPADPLYATVKVGGRVVASLSNSGVASFPRSADAIPGLTSDGIGPELAAARAAQIAQALGGTVEMAPTALSQTQWTASPYARSLQDSSRGEQALAQLSALLDAGSHAAIQRQLQQAAEPMTP